MKKLLINNNKSLFLEEFDKTNKTHVDDLFFLIKNKSHNISNVFKPSRDQHEDFCENHPYRFWYLLYSNEKLQGSIYITFENALGINLIDPANKDNHDVIKYLLNNIEPMPAIPSVVQGKFYSNVSPNNTELIKLLKSLGASISQVSYKFK
jgi:hypothetical protein